MNPVNLAEVGYVVRTHGVKGHLRINFTKNIKELSVGEALFLLQKGMPAPFFIKEIEYLQGTEAFVLFEDITTKEDAQLFTKKPVYGPEENLVTQTEHEKNFEGFLVKDQNNTSIGNVLSSLDVQEYDLLEVDYNGKSILLPFHENIIIRIDEKKKVITLQILEGLLTL